MHAVILLLAVLFCSATPVLALEVLQSGVDATMELNYADYRGEEEAVTNSGNHFTQQYTLLYRNSGLLNGGRGGQYALSVGFEYNVLNSDINGTSNSLATGKLLYNGGLTLAPGGLPFRLHLFAHDMHRTSFVRETTMQPSSGDYVNSWIFNPAINSDMTNGARRVFGTTLLVGIRNGSYLGQYRETLSHLPRLLVDYKQIDVDDHKTLTPERSRSRDLAFISLNKKDNWFHLRMRDHVNYYDPSRNYNENSILIGSVDNYNARQWINLTNWIKLSADISYTESFEAFNNTESEEYKVNAFSVTRRSNWTSNSFITYSRDRTDDDLEKNLQMPVAVSVTLSPDTSLRTQMSLDRRSSKLMMEQPGLLNPNFDSNTDNYFLQGQFLTRQRALHAVTYDFGLESNDGPLGQGYGVRLGANWFSNGQRSLADQSSLGYWFTYARGPGQNSENGSYSEHVLRASYEHASTSRVRYGASEFLSYGGGDVSSGAVTRIALGSLGGSPSGQSFANDGSQVFRSRSQIFYEQLSGQGFGHRASLGYELYAGKVKENLVDLTDALTYTGSRLRYQLTSALSYGDLSSSGDATKIASAPSNASYGGGANLILSVDGSVDYTPVRNMRVSGGLSWSQVHRDGGKSTQRNSVTQGMEYNWITVNGVQRTLASISEEFTYETLSPSDGEQITSYTLLSRGNFYPTANLSCGATGRYRIYAEPEGIAQLALTTHAEASYEKLTLGLYFSVGNRSAGENYRERSERRYEVKLKKIF